MRYWLKASFYFSLVVVLGTYATSSIAQDNKPPVPVQAPQQQAQVQAPKPVPAPPTPAVKPVQPSDPKKPRSIQIAFFQLEAQGVDQKVSSIVTDMLLSELHKMKDARVIGSKEVDAMLGYEQKKQMSGCTDTSCMVAIGGALGVDKILMGSVGKLGTSYTLNLKLLNVLNANIEEMFSKRMKGGDEEDFLDAIPEALAILFPASASTWVKTGRPPPIVPPPPVEVLDLQRTPSQMKAPPTVQETPKKQESSKPVGVASQSVNQAEKPLSHAGKFLLGAKALASIPAFNAAGEILLGYGAGKWVEVGVVGIFSTSYGGAPRCQAFVYNPEGQVKPFLAVQLPMYWTPDGFMMGIEGTAGVQWDFHKMVGLTFEMGVDYNFVRPGGYKDVIPVGMLGLQVRI